jgi:hypothetical protein
MSQVQEEEEQKRIRSELEAEEEKVLRRCKKDADCSSDEVCAFNESNELHFCIPNKLYVGCMNDGGWEKRKPTYKTASTEKVDIESVEKCYGFARRLNDSTHKYQYVVYRPRKDPAVIDPKKVTVSLVCADRVILDFPFEDSFDYSCLVEQQMCVIRPLKQTVALIEKNRTRCTDPNSDFHLEVRYQCVGYEDEGVVKVPLPPGATISPIQLMCPVKESDRDFALGECTAFGYDDIAEVPLDSMMDRNTIPQTCSAPVYMVPNLVDDLDTYHEYVQKSLRKKSAEIESMVQSDESDLQKMKAIQYALKYEATTGKKMDYKEAFGRVVEHVETSIPCDDVRNWEKMLMNRSPLNLTNLDFSQLDFIGENLMSEDAIRLSACALPTKPDYIIFFSESSTDATKQKKAYGVSLETIISMEEASGKNVVMTNNWYPATGVVVYVNKSYETQTKILTYMNEIIMKDYQGVNDDIMRNVSILRQVQERRDSEVETRETELDQFIQTMNQKIRITNEASDLHKNMIRYAYFAVIILFILSVFYVVYQYYARTATM